MFIVIAAFIILVLGCSALYKKKKSAEKANKRISSLRMEFNNVKEGSRSKNGYDWIEERLNDEDHDLDDMNIENKI